MAADTIHSDDEDYDAQIVPIGRQTYQQVRSGDVRSISPLTTAGNGPFNAHPRPNSAHSSHPASDEQLTLEDHDKWQSVQTYDAADDLTPHFVHAVKCDKAAQEASESFLEKGGATTPTPGYKQTRRVLRIWHLEIIATLVAVGPLIAILCVLAAYNGKQTSTWRASTNLTTLVTILSTISRVALVMVASEIISQAKLSRFWSLSSAPKAQGVPLKNLEEFDRASRGLWGSLSLFKRSLRRPALLVTFIGVLVSVSMGSFAQQAVRVIQCDYVDDKQTASIPIINKMGYIGEPEYNSQYVFGKFHLNLAVKAAIVSLFSNSNGNDLMIQATCTSGNCTFLVLEINDGHPITHRSVGFCSRCTDISSHITSNTTTLDWDPPLDSGQQCWWSLPNGAAVSYMNSMQATGNGLAMDVISEFLDISSENPFNWSSPIPDAAVPFLNASRYALLNISVLSQMGGQRKVSHQDTIRDPALVSLLLPALWKIHDAVDISAAPGSETLSLKVFGTIAPFNNKSGLTWDEALDALDRVNKTAPPGCMYAANHFSWFYAIQDFLVDALHGTCSTPDQLEDGIAPVCSGTGVEPFWLESLAQVPNGTYPVISQFMDDFAESLTRKLRIGIDGATKPSQIQPKGGPVGQDAPVRSVQSMASLTTVTGSAWQTTTRVGLDFGVLRMWMERWGDGMEELSLAIYITSLPL
ncbi:hypothetical protein F5Y15DRAFT_419412 [Xylariaceae sp. FL0016]|nr:hypothetical protein F5Y15DRAFT_419412 [Xylariaceae sp. FL0016]